LTVLNQGHWLVDYAGPVLSKAVRYQSYDEDSARWQGFEFRPGDIVISTRSKSGTTWMQMICALLIFQRPDLPAPLGRLSPWLDWLITPREQVLARLGAQQHRRFIKTHTPLDGLPLDPRATYIVVGRHPLDMAVSLYCQSRNIDRERVRELTGRCGPDDARKPQPALHDWLISWIDSQDRPEEQLDSLPGVMWHLSDAWARRTSPPTEPPEDNDPVRDPGVAVADSGVAVPDSGSAGPAVLLVHYDDLSADLDGEMRRLAALLGITVPEQVWPDLVLAATFERMRAGAAAQAPDPAGILKDPAAFFRRGYSGAGHEELEQAELARYYARAARLAPPDLLSWLHRQRLDDHGQDGQDQGAAAGQQRPVAAAHGRMESAVTG
jgi:aryl sulfotransferase